MIWEWARSRVQSEVDPELPCDTCLLAGSSPFFSFTSVLTSLLSTGTGFPHSCSSCQQGPHMASPTSTNPAHDHFETFVQAQLCQDVLSSFQGLCRALGVESGGGLPQYHKIKAQLNYWSAKSLWAKLDKRASQPAYQQGQACTNTKVDT